MLERWRLSGCKPLITAIYAVAMLSLGVAHAYAGLPETNVFEAAALQAAAFATLDGLWAPIGGQSKPGVRNLPAGGVYKSPAGTVSCDASRLTAAPGAIPPPLADPSGLSTKLPPVRTLASGAAGAVVEPQSRGPPLYS